MILCVGDFEVAKPIAPGIHRSFVAARTDRYGIAAL
jgi:hypothetical protein